MYVMCVIGKKKMFNVGLVEEAEVKAEVFVAEARLSIWLALLRPRQPKPSGIGL
jgi:hypothetical protein